MAIDYKNPLDMLKLKEDEPMMSEMSSADYENMQSSISPDMLYSTPQIADDLPKKTEESQVPVVAQTDSDLSNLDRKLTPLERYEALIKEYKNSDQQKLEDARKTDRMLKVGGAIGDALATYINAQNQKNVMAPGVQVQQGAGLGKVAEMLATAPDIASDIKTNREALLKQYEILAKAQGKDLSQSPSAWQVVPIVKDGIQQYVTVNKITNEVKPIGEKATYQQFRVDPADGNIYAYNPVQGVRSSSNISKSTSPVSTPAQQEKELENAEKNIVQLVKETTSQLNPNQRKTLEKTRTAFNNDTKDIRDKLDSISELVPTLELAPNNAAAANAFGTQLAKMYQDGRLSDKDVDLYIKNKALAQKIKSSFYDITKGTMDPKLVPVYKELITEMQKGAISKLDDRANYFATQSLGTFIENPDIRKELIYPKQIIQYEKPKQKQDTEYEPKIDKVKKQLTDEEQKALDWANKNPEDSRAIKIKEVLKR